MKSPSGLAKIVVPAVSAAVLAASTATLASATAPVSFDSCSVVTQAEAAAAIGQSVTTGVLGHATVEGGLACVFYGPSAPKPRRSERGPTRHREGSRGQGIQRLEVVQGLQVQGCCSVGERLRQPGVL